MGREERSYTKVITALSLGAAARIARLSCSASVSVSVFEQKAFGLPDCFQLLLQPGHTALLCQDQLCAVKQGCGHILIMDFPCHGQFNSIGEAQLLQLIREVNRCSENRTELCRHRTFEEGDVYCCYCGALTTYAAEKYQGEKERKEG